MVKPPESSDENIRRISKSVRNKSETRRNPITEGDPEDNLPRPSSREVFVRVD